MNGKVAAGHEIYFLKIEIMGLHPMLALNQVHVLRLVRDSVVRGKRI